MSNPLYPLTVFALPCEHFMVVGSKEEQEAFEESHRTGCGADDFREQSDNSPFSP